MGPHAMAAPHNDDRTLVRLVRECRDTLINAAIDVEKWVPAHAASDWDVRLGKIVKVPHLMTGAMGFAEDACEKIPGFLTEEMGRELRPALHLLQQRVAQLDELTGRATASFAIANRGDASHALDLTLDRLRRTKHARARQIVPCPLRDVKSVHDWREGNQRDIEHPHPPARAIESQPERLLGEPIRARALVGICQWRILSETIHPVAAGRHAGAERGPEGAAIDSSRSLRASTEGGLQQLGEIRKLPSRRPPFHQRRVAGIHAQEEHLEG
jgi:hypothetical protein